MLSLIRFVSIVAILFGSLAVATKHELAPEQAELSFRVGALMPEPAPMTDDWDCIAGTAYRCNLCTWLDINNNTTWRCSKPDNLKLCMLIPLGEGCTVGVPEYDCGMYQTGIMVDGQCANMISWFLPCKRPYCTN